MLSGELLTVGVSGRPVNSTLRSVVPGGRKQIFNEISHEEKGRPVALVAKFVENYRLQTTIHFNASINIGCDSFILKTACGYYEQFVDTSVKGRPCCALLKDVYVTRFP